MTTKKIKKETQRILILCVLCIQGIAFGQESNALSYDTATKNQLGIGVSRFVNSIFPSDDNSFLLEYRYSKTPVINYRLGANYSYDSGEEGDFAIGLKVGIDKVFLQKGNWYFYYGMDIGGSENFYKKTKKHIGDVFVSPFMGIMYKFNKSFSISTEPNIYYKLNFVVDKGTYERDNKKWWGKSGFGKIGYLQLNFHF